MLLEHTIYISWRIFVPNKDRSQALATSVGGETELILKKATHGLIKHMLIIIDILSLNSNSEMIVLF
jgi:hypothetical protein